MSWLSALQYPKRHSAVFNAVGFLILFATAHANTQTCHPTSLRDSSATRFHLGFTTIAATFHEVERGDYQGIIQTLGWHHPWVDETVTRRWLGGVPLDDMGVKRQLIGPGLQRSTDKLDAAIETLVAVAGDPFDVRVSIAIGTQL